MLLIRLSVSGCILSNYIGKCADPIEPEAVNKTHRRITLCWYDGRSDRDDSHVEVHCQRGEDLLVCS